MKYVYFTADWCGPCQSVKPKLMASGKPIQLVNIDTNKDLVEKYNIKRVPTLLITQGDTIIGRYVGAPEILTFLNT